MTKASFSDLLTHVGAIADGELRELEKLADNFPYCQTAHTLIAKALHDRGSMLAGQKLRRAATYAPDRAVLRRLLLEPMLADAAPIAAPEVGIKPAEEPTPALAVSAEGELIVAEAASLTAEPAAETSGPDADIPLLTAANGGLPFDPSAEILGSDSALISIEGQADKNTNFVLASELAETAEAGPVVSSPVLIDLDLVPNTTGAAAFDMFLFEPTAAQEAATGGLLLLPESLPVALLAPAAELPPAPPLPALGPDAAIRYTLPSSRYGTELTAADFTGLTDFAAPSADLLAEIPPQMQPDARWPEHLAINRPATPVVARPFSHQFALIDRFLRDKPRLRNVDPTRPLPDKVPDLAQDSARVPSGGIASENMARIFARQGKTSRAIGVYEQLMARNPEKSAYFAEQIAALRAKPAS